MGFRHAEAGLAGLACCVLFALSPGEVRAQTTTAKIVYCCDVGGQPVCGDILPAACYGRAYREVLGRHYPAMALVQVVALVEDRAKVEIEVTAVVPD